MTTNTKRIVDYQREKFPFRKSVEGILGVTDLEQLHKKEGAPSEIVKPGKDNHTPWHHKFYAGMESQGFLKVYDDFLTQFVRPLIKEPIVVQARPTFRIHWVGNLGVGAFHRDSEYNHPVEELNFWVPVTPAFGTNTIWLESEPDKGDYHPERVNFGQALTFQGGVLVHGNKVNDTNSTRVSFDFRVIPKSIWVEPKEVKTGLAYGRQFKIGDYYRLIE